MNEQLQKELITWLSMIREAGANFALDQAPQIIQEKILYGRIVEPIGLLSLIFSAYVIYRVIRWSWQDDRDEEVTALVTLFGSLALVAVFVASMVEVSLIIQIYLAPQLYIVEWLAGLIKS